LVHKISRLKKIIVKNVNHYKSVLLLTIPLILSTFTHLWSPIGFPDVFYDEGVYMRRAMHVLDGFGPQELFEGVNPYYDHPYFGQLFLAGIFEVIGFPNVLLNFSLSSDSNVLHSIQMLYLVPRELMGVFAVVDTFLLYKISERRYNRNIAFIASILFAVMPITWLTRMVLLDSILLPFLLSSILFAVYCFCYTKNSSSNGDDTNYNISNKKKNIPSILLSGIFLGLAIFTKIPAFTMILLVGYLVYTNANNHKKELKFYILQFSNNRNLKTLGIWFIPVTLIPLIWTAYSISLGQFNYWLGGVIHQGTERHIYDKTLLDATNIFFQTDPVLFVLGMVGFIYAAIKRDFFLLLWIIPYTFFLQFIGYVQYFYWIPVLPAFSIAAAKLILDLSNKINKKKVQKILPFIIISAIGLFGLVSTTMLITTDITTQFQSAAFVAKYLGDSSNGNKDTTIISSPIYSWIFNYIYKKTAYGFSDFKDALFLPIKTKKILLISDPHFISDMRSSKQLQTIYNNTASIAKFKGGVISFNNYKYPYTSMNVNSEGSEVEIRIN
jgi:dolichyl-phosphate-mannose-protein mannosyltransferase